MLCGMVLEFRHASIEGERAIIQSLYTKDATFLPMTAVT